MDHSSEGGRVSAVDGYGRIDRWGLRANEAVLVILLIAMAVLVFGNVASRVLSGQSWGWADELARMMLVWLVMSSVGIVLRRGGHLALEIVASSRAPRLSMALRAVVLAVIAAFGLYAIRAGIGYAILGRDQSSPVLSVSYAYVYAAIPFGFALMLYHAARVARDFVRHGVVPSVAQA